MTIAAIRHNNPGDVSIPIRGWIGPGVKVGVVGQPGFAHFPDMRTGFAAFQQRIFSYITGWHLDTIRRLHSAYTPESSWALGVVAMSQIGLDDHLNVEDGAQMRNLMRGILFQETGMNPTQLGIAPEDFNRGLDPIFPHFVSR